MVVIKKEHNQASAKNHKISQMADGPYRVLTSDPTTVTVRTGTQDKRFSSDRVVAEPPLLHSLRDKILAPTTDQLQPAGAMSPTTSTIVPRQPNTDPPDHNSSISSTTDDTQYIIDHIFYYSHDCDHRYWAR